MATMTDDRHVIRYVTNHGAFFWGRSYDGPHYVITWICDLDLAYIYSSRQQADAEIERFPLRGVAQPFAAALALSQETVR